MRASKMQKRFYVISEDGNDMSYNDKKNSSEHFTSLGAAQKRAEELAEEIPGNAYLIAVSIERVIAEAKPVTRTAIR